MIGQILGAMEVLGIIGLFLHYTKIEVASVGILILIWCCFILPWILLLFILRNRKIKGKERKHAEVKYV